jgi:hypothetical protein
MVQFRKVDSASSQFVSGSIASGAGQRKNHIALLQPHIPITSRRRRPLGLTRVLASSGSARGYDFAANDTANEDARLLIWERLGNGKMSEAEMIVWLRANIVKI